MVIPEAYANTRDFAVGDARESALAPLAGDHATTVPWPVWENARLTMTSHEGLAMILAICSVP